MRGLRSAVTRMRQSDSERVDGMLRASHAVVVGDRTLWLGLTATGSTTPTLRLRTDSGAAVPLPWEVVAQREGLAAGHADLGSAREALSGDSTRFTVEVAGPGGGYALPWDPPARRDLVVTAGSDVAAFWRVAGGDTLVLVGETPPAGPRLAALALDPAGEPVLTVISPSPVTALRLVAAGGDAGLPAQEIELPHRSGAGWRVPADQLGRLPRDVPAGFEARTQQGWQPLLRRWVDLRISREQAVALPQVSSREPGAAWVATLVFRPDRQLAVRVTGVGPESGPRGAGRP